MIIFLYGPDSYRRQEKLKEYIGRYKAKFSAFSLSHFYLSQNDDLQKLKDFSRSNSLFESSKFGIVWDMCDLEKGGLKDFSKLIKENLESKDLTLIISADKKPVKELNFLLKKPVIFHEFENLDLADFAAFIQKEAGRLQITVDRSCVALLAEAFKNNTWGAVTELEKLSLLDEKRITGDIIRNHIAVFNEVNLFTALNTLRSSGSSFEKLRVFEELLSRNTDPAMLFNMIAVAPYEGKAWKELVADYDVALKTGKMEYEEILLDIALR